MIDVNAKKSLILFTFLLFIPVVGAVTLDPYTILYPNSSSSNFYNLSAVLVAQEVACNGTHTLFTGLDGLNMSCYDNTDITDGKELGDCRQASNCAIPTPSSNIVLTCTAQATAEGSGRTSGGNGDDDEERTTTTTVEGEPTVKVWVSDCTKEEIGDCDVAPDCDAVGTESEGWYCEGELLKYDECAGCEAVLEVEEEFPWVWLGIGILVVVLIGLFVFFFVLRR